MRSAKRWCARWRQDCATDGFFFAQILILLGWLWRKEDASGGDIFKQKKAGLRRGGFYLEEVRRHRYTLPKRGQDMDWLKAEVMRIGNTARWSWQGWCAAWASEKSIRQWTGVNILSVLLSLVLDLTGGERALILALGLLVLAAELINTALEETVDYISTKQDPRAGKIKDCGSAVVAVTAIAGGVAWLAILFG